MDHQPSSARHLRVVLSEDRFRAWLEGGGHAAPPSSDEIIACAQAAGVALTDELRQRAAELARGWTASGPPGGFDEAGRVLLAEGHRPVEAEDGAFEWAPPFAECLARPTDGRPVDHFALPTVITVEAGTVIGRVRPPRPGSPGMDVTGESRRPRRSEGRPLRLMAGVRQREGSDELLAETAGRVFVEGGKVRVSEVLEIPGDVDLASGSVDACVDVHVRGAVREKFKVRTTGALLVDQVIEAADVEAGGDVLVGGGIFGQNRNGRLRAGGNLSTHLINEAIVTVGGDLRVNKEIINSEVCVAGRLLAERGTIIGGSVTARAGQHVRILGSEAFVPTQVAAGPDVNELRRARRMEREAREIDKAAVQLRATVQPLMANIKRLMPAQRERATELLARADELAARVTALEQQADTIRRAATPSAPPAILVGEALYPGVRLLLGWRETRISRLLHGPLRIELSKTDDGLQIVARNERTGSSIVLPGTDVDLDAPPNEAAPAPAGNE